MKFKLDENFGTRTHQLFKNAGHDVQTVREESLGGASDQRIYEVCCAEQRCLVTLDLDFASIIRFPPQKANGIVVIRAPRNPSVFLLERLVRQFLQALAQRPVGKNVWIVELDRIRIHLADVEEEQE